MDEFLRHTETLEQSGAEERGVHGGRVLLSPFRGGQRRYGREVWTRTTNLTPEVHHRARRNLQMSVYTVRFRTTSQRVRAVTEQTTPVALGRYSA